ncbi:MAG TPA: class I SAM-dependent methyltransferase [bacterium]
MGHDDPDAIRRHYEDAELARAYTAARFSRPLGAVQHRRQLAAVNDAIARIGASRVLELACGPARLTAGVTGMRRGVAVDASAEMLAEAKRRMPPDGPWEFRLGDAFSLDLGETFDVVYTFRLLRHFRAPERARLYSTMQAHLRDGGLAVFDAIHVAKPRMLARVESREPARVHDHVFGSASALTDELEGAGFEVVELRGLIRHVVLQSVVSRLTAWMRMPAAGEALIERIERMPGGRPLEWIVLCRTPSRSS